MKYYDIKEISLEKTIRFDINYTVYQNNILQDKYTKFLELFDIVTDNKVNLEELLDKDFGYVEIGNSNKYGEVEPINLNFDNRSHLNENLFKKIEKNDIIKVKNGDILILKVRPNLKKYILIDQDQEKLYYTSAFLHLRPKKLNKLIFYQLKTTFYNNLIAISRQGKGYPTLSTNDLTYLKFTKRIIDALINHESALMLKIEPIEQQIKELKSQIIDQKLIINEVFAQEFGFDMEQFEELKQESKFFVSLMNISTQLLRSTVVQNSLRTQYIKSFLSKINTLSIKDILIQEIKRGKQPEYKHDGVKVIKTINISKTGIINFNSENTTYVSDTFAKNNKERIACKNDILLSSTGEGRGKFALYSDDENALVDSHISIIRYNSDKVNPLFFLLFSLSFFGKEQLRYIEMHIKGTPEIYAEQLKYFQIPNIPFSHQQEIVNKIQTKVDAQNKITKQIQALRNKIDDIMNEVIHNAH